jgi:hypothetical protein
MPLVSGSIPNLINGVSQQPPSLRLKTQAELQENGVSSVVNGLLKRPGTEHLKMLTGTGNPLAGITNVDNAFIHAIRRDNDTLNTLVVTNVGGTAYVYMFDRDGNTLSVSGSYTYLNTATNPREDLAAVTIADYTYILNKKQAVGIGSALTPLPSTDVNRRYEALVYTKQGDYQTTYTLKVRRPGGSWSTQSYTTGKSTNTAVADTQAAEASIKTDNIANQLNNISLPSGISKTRYNNVIHLYSSSDFEVEVEDSRGNTHLLGFKEEVSDFKSLPKDGADGFLIKVSGDNDKAQDDYYVKLKSGTTGQGVWKETIKPEIAYQFDAATMPHQIKRTGATTYLFEPVTWAERKVGDDDSNPFPIFAEDGLVLNDIFFHKNRMGLLYDENIILSESGEFEEFNFFRRTVLTLVDSDPIDVAVSNNQVSILEHAVPFNESLILFSAQTQFRLNSLDVLAPDTVSVDVTTQFEASLKAKPVGAGRFVYFPVQRGRWSGIREYFVDVDTETNDAVDITSHVPQYIEGIINKLEASSNEDTILCTTDANNKTLYVYRYYWQNKEKLQASWSKWTFEGEILNFAFDKSDIFMIMKYSDGSITLEKINLSTDDATLDTLGNWSVHLDRRIKLSSGGTTTMPYSHTNMTYVTEDGVLTTAAKVPGLLTAGKIVYAGIPYRFRYVFSEQVMRQDKEPITISRLQLRAINVVYNDTGFFNAEVIPKGATNTANRNSYTTTFSGKTVGGITNILNQPAISDGTFRINTMANAEGLHVELYSDSHLPCAFQSAEWEGFYRLRSTRI